MMRDEKTGINNSKVKTGDYSKVIGVLNKYGLDEKSVKLLFEKYTSKIIDSHRESLSAFKDDINDIIASEIASIVLAVDKTAGSVENIGDQICNQFANIKTLFEDRFSEIECNFNELCLSQSDIASSIQVLKDNSMRQFDVVLQQLIDIHKDIQKISKNTDIIIDRLETIQGARGEVRFLEVLHGEIIKDYINQEEIIYTCNQIIHSDASRNGKFIAEFYKVLCENNTKYKSEYIEKMLEKLQDDTSVDVIKEYIEDVLKICIVFICYETIDNVRKVIERVYKLGWLSPQEHEKCVGSFEAETKKLRCGEYDVEKNRSIFIIYKSEDIKYVENICKKLENRGLECFYADRNLQRSVGGNYEEKLHNAMDHCMGIIYVSSERSRHLITNINHELKHLRATDRQRAKENGIDISCVYEELPVEIKKPRVEYIIDDPEKDRSPIPDIVVEVFSGYTRLGNMDEVVRSIYRQISQFEDFIKIQNGEKINAIRRRGNKRSKDDNVRGGGEHPIHTTIKIESELVKPDYPTLKNYDKEEFEINGTELKRYKGNGKIAKIPYGVTSLCVSAFLDCINLTNIEIPNSVTSISMGAFNGCKSIKNFEIPDSVVNIEPVIDIDLGCIPSLFGGCDNLIYICVSKDNPKYYSAGNCIIETGSGLLVAGCNASRIPDDGSITSIGIGAFCDCRNLIDIKIPEGVISIGCGAFYNCEKLKEIILPDSIEDIGMSAFFGCSSLTNINIPKDVINIVMTEENGVVDVLGPCLFGSCSNLIQIIVSENNTKYHSDGNCIIETDSCELIAGSEKSIIPQNGSVTKIGGSAFSGCDITSIDISWHIKSFGELAYHNCLRLKNIHFFGTIDQWNNIDKGDGWDDNVGEGKYTVHCSDGKILVVDGKITVEKAKLHNIDSYYSKSENNKPVNRVKIGVIGIGSCGSNVVNDIIASGVKVDMFMAIDTDYQALCNSKAEKRIQIGSGLTSGLGAGTNIEIGKQAAEEGKETLASYIKDMNLVFITAGMGGGTGTGAAPVIAEIAHNLGILTISLVTTPFLFEGESRMRNAQMGIGNLRKFVDSIVIVPNERLASIAKDMNMTMKNAYRYGNDILRQDVQVITDFIVNPGKINVDFEDIRTILTNGGDTLIGTGRAGGANRATEALKKAVNIAVLGTTIEDATRVIINVEGTEVKMQEMQNVVSLVRGVCAKDANIIFGTAIVPALKDDIQVTIIATGFHGGGEERIHFAKSIAQATESVVVDGEHKPSIKSSSNNAEKQRAIHAGANADNYPTLENYDKKEFEINGTALVKYNGNGKIAKIPYGVTSIGIDAFLCCSSLTSIEIPNGVTSIGSRAFKECSSLTSIEIPDGVTCIGDGAFLYCSSITNIEIPNSVTSIEDSAFYGCSRLTNIEMPSNVTSIKYDVFAGCSGLKSIEIPNSVTSIEGSAFYGCSSITSIEIPNGVTSIGRQAFAGCSGLTSIEIPSSVTSIENWAFSYCSSLTSIEIPNGVTSIGGQAFAGCSGLKSITVFNGNNKYHSSNNCLIKTESKTLICGCKSSVIPTDGSVTSIGDLAFSGCNGLTSIEIPNSVTSIRLRAFFDCSSLTNITIPNNVTNIVSHAFQNCEKLNEISFLGTIYQWSSIKKGNGWDDNVGAGKYSVHCSDGKIHVVDGKITVEKAEFEIDGTRLKRYNRNGKTAKIPYGVTSIGYEAFIYCCNLTSIEIPSSVTSIENWAFSYCSSLTSIKIPNGVKSIGGRAFSGCSSLTSIKIPNGVKSIGWHAFDGCSSLTSIEIPDGVTCIGDNAFYDCSNLTSIKIPSSVTSIGCCAFSGCSSLTSIEIPSSVSSIGGCAFYRCSSLTSIKISNSVTKIGDGTFSYCSSLTGIEIPSSVTSIGWRVFSGCSGLTSIKIPNGVKSIGGRAFSGCSGLTSIEIPECVTCIGDNAFSYCSSLTSIKIPSSVTSIGDDAFEGCSSLMSIQYNNTKKQWKKIIKMRSRIGLNKGCVVYCTDSIIKL